MSRRIESKRWWRVRCGSAGVLGLLMSLSACGGSQPEAKAPAAGETPEEILGDEPASGAAAPASSPDVEKGIEALRNEDFASAKTILTRAVAADARDAQAVFYLGVAESGLGETELAIEHLRKALELDPKLSEAALNLSALLLDREQYPEALQAAEQGLAVAPADPGLLQNKAMALLMTGKEAEAAPLFEQVVAKKPDDEGLRFLYAQSLMAAGNQAKAKEQLLGLTQSKDREVLASAADALGRLKAWDACVDALTRAIDMQAESELYVKRGLCLHGKDDENRAKADFEKAAELDPKSAKAQFYLGHNLRTRGDKKGAKQAFKKAIELEPEGPMADAAKAALGKL
jgi:Tfp pilus assembly protein PilF